MTSPSSSSSSPWTIPHSPYPSRASELALAIVLLSLLFLLFSILFLAPFGIAALWHQLRRGDRPEMEIVLALLILLALFSHMYVRWLSVLISVHRSQNVQDASPVQDASSVPDSPPVHDAPPPRFHKNLGEARNQVLTLAERRQHNAPAPVIISQSPKGIESPITALMVLQYPIDAPQVYDAPPAPSFHKKLGEVTDQGLTLTE